MRYLSLLLALWIPATAQVAPMLNLVVLEGEGATNNIRQRTAREPIVQVQDENHNCGLYAAIQRSGRRLR